MRKVHFLTRPTPVTQLGSEDLEELFSDDWREKAERLQMRRWRKLKREMF
jgi:hypothetical protein